VHFWKLYQFSYMQVRKKQILISNWLSITSGSISNGAASFTDTNVLQLRFYRARTP